MLIKCYKWLHIAFYGIPDNLNTVIQLCRTTVGDPRNV